MHPTRHQMRRNEPLPEGVVRVDRATMWGNPFRADMCDAACITAMRAGASTAAEAYRLWLEGHPDLAHIEPQRRQAILDNIGVLHGKDLACWCTTDVPRGWCHADELLLRARDATPTIGDALGRPDNVPRIALSVRQPWAWAIICEGKEIENRTEPSVRMGGMRAQIGKRIAIHASKGMGREEYEDAREFMGHLGVACPPAADLLRGGVIGTVYVEDIVSEHTSPWFCGPRGLVLSDPRPLPFIGASGELGMFQWNPNHAQPAPPAKWMLPQEERVVGKAKSAVVPEVSTQADMFTK